MTFSEALAAWEKWEDKSITGGLVFCDWAEEGGLDPYYTANWRRWCCPAYGSEHIGNELRRLAKAEAADARKGVRHAAKAS